MELQVNRLEARIEMKEMFNKDLEEKKKSQSIMNNVITEDQKHSGGNQQ